MVWEYGMAFYEKPVHKAARKKDIYIYFHIL